MAGRFIWRRFDEIDLSDAFFDPLKADYPEFVEWFGRKAREQQSALTYVDDEGVGAFVYYKEENEAIALQERTLAAMPRLKIGTLRLAERIRNLRLGEGAIGVCLGPSGLEPPFKTYLFASLREKTLSLFTVCFDFT